MKRILFGIVAGKIGQLVYDEVDMDTMHIFWTVNVGLRCDCEALTCLNPFGGTNREMLSHREHPYTTLRDNLIVK